MFHNKKNVRFDIKNVVATDGFEYSGSGIINDILKDADYPQNDDIVEGRYECAESLKNMIKQWRSEVDITITK